MSERIGGNMAEKIYAHFDEWFKSIEFKNNKFYNDHIYDLKEGIDLFDLNAVKKFIIGLSRFSWDARQPEIDELKTSIDEYRTSYQNCYEDLRNKQSEVDELNDRVDLLEDRLLEVNVMHGKIINELKQKLDVAVECLEFYGDKENYMDLYLGNYGLIDESDCGTCGKKSRECLEKIKGG